MSVDLARIRERLSPYIDYKKAVIALSVLVIGSKVVGTLRKQAATARILKVGEDKRKQRDAQIASEIIPDNEVPEEIRRLILSSNVSQLQKLLNEDRITSEQILKTYHSRAITIGLRYNLIGESNYKEALELARKCDEIRRNTKPEDRHKLGKLFGIPMSIKDSFIQKGLDNTIGSVANCFKPCPKDGEILALLKSKGVIPFIRSNVPQTLAILDCTNYVWGRSINPWNKDRTIGGSSGGEAGLVLTRCSPIGLASDALGSIRIPSAFCGLPGFKPTKGRYVAKGHGVKNQYSQSKYTYIYTNSGPIARCVDDLVLFTTELITEEGREYDPISPYVPWNEEKYHPKNKLRIGYTVSEDFFGAAQPCKRAVREAAEALKKLGHEVFEVKIPNFERLALFIPFLTSSEGKGREYTTMKEPVVSELKPQVSVKALPTFIKKTVRRLMKFLGYDRLAKIVEMGEEVTTDQFHEKMNEFFEIREQLYDFFVNNKFDAILSPVLALPPFKHGFGVDLALAACYNWPANIANLPAGVVPVTTVKEGEDIYSAEDAVYQDKLSQMAELNMKGSVGLPVGVQVMSLPWEDEKCLAVMKAIEGEVNFKGLPDIQ